MRAATRTGCESRAGAARANGLLVLVCVVLLGLATGVGFYRWKRGESDANLAAELAAAPRGFDERLDLWLRYNGPQIHHRLAVVARFTTEMPWLVTHAVVDPAGGPPEIWGIDCATLPKDLARREGTRVVVELPAPRMLGHAALPGEGAGRVPLLATQSGLDPGARLAALARYLLEGLPDALTRDIPGAALEIRVAH